MDEFFDFEDATDPVLVLQRVDGLVPASHPTLSGYDIDLILDQAASVDGFLTPFQQSASNFTPDLDEYSPSPSDIHMGRADDFNQQNDWARSAGNTSKPCLSCQSSNLDCVRVPTSHLTGQQKCANCNFLSLPCNISFEDSNSQSKPTKPQRNVNRSALSWGEEVGADGYPVEAPIGAQNKRQEPTRGANDECDKNHGQSSLRFSRDTVRLLRTWLSIHHLHPYPTDDEKEALQQKTGLTKIQITNWLANARRRGQVRAPSMISSPTSHQPRSVPSPRQSEATLENMDPMERWEKLPPEHEPASVIDIAKAMETSPVQCLEGGSPFSYPRSNDGSAPSVARATSISSRDTSKSSHASLRSGLSRHSQTSLGQKGRRRRRPVNKAGTNPATIIPRQYQCTFCIETFKTKHDWQRHEKSLHLSLERWICSPDVNRFADHASSCAFCGIRNPDRLHLEEHNYTLCRERSLDERTFYRKDHLRQHLRLVHECQFQPTTMESWKVAAPEVRSCCGFCGHIMETWAARTNHLAEHYKAGKSMADWKGSWGFEPDVQKLVENGTQPYLIHSKRTVTISKDLGPPLRHQDKSPYDRVKARLAELATREAKLGHDLTNDKLKLEAARCMAEYEMSVDPNYLVKSWFSDLLMCPDDSVWRKGLKHAAVSRVGNSRTKNSRNTNDRTGAEKYCEFERQLADYVNAQRALGLSPSNADLRAAGCRILMEYDRRYSNVRSATVAIWVCEQIMTSHGWIDRFRERLGLQPSFEASGGEMLGGETDSTTCMYRKLETKLAEFARGQVATGGVPSDTDLQRQARLIVFGVDDPLLQTAADDGAWLAQFRLDHGISEIDSPSYLTMYESPGNSIKQELSNGVNIGSSLEPFSQLRLENAPPIGSQQHAECYRWIGVELSRYVASCMSRHSSNPYFPSDDEIRQQARWIVHNDDDPRNQTVADNDEWLLCFKHFNGFATFEDGHSLPSEFELADMNLGIFGSTSSTMSTNILPPQDQNVHNLVTPDNLLSFNPTPAIAASTPFHPWSIDSCLDEHAYHFREQGLLSCDSQVGTNARVMADASITAGEDSAALYQLSEVYDTSSRPIQTPVPSRGSAKRDSWGSERFSACREEWMPRGKSPRMGQVSAQVRIGERVGSPLSRQTGVQMMEEDFQRRVEMGTRR